MPFPESIKLEAKKKSNFKCCVCHNPFVEVHHILPQAEGGSDELDNAAPLCGGCHHKFGGNPELRKQLREMRDHWWQTCPTLTVDGSSDFVRTSKPVSKLNVLECRATLRIHHGVSKSNDAEALIANDGETVCYINNMRLISDVFDLETVRISFDHSVAYGTTGRGNESPLRLNAGDMKRVYIRTQEFSDKYDDQLPNSVQIQIEFGSVPVTVCLARDGDRSVYLFKNSID